MNQKSYLKLNVVIMIRETINQRKHFKIINSAVISTDVMYSWTKIFVSSGRKVYCVEHNIGLKK